MSWRAVAPRRCSGGGNDLSPNNPGHMSLLIANGAARGHARGFNHRRIAPHPPCAARLDWPRPLPDLPTPTTRRPYSPQRRCVDLRLMLYSRGLASPRTYQRGSISAPTDLLGVFSHGITSHRGAACRARAASRHPLQHGIQVARLRLRLVLRMRRAPAMLRALARKVNSRLYPGNGHTSSQHRAH